jgi:heterodisulfide reductase subunit D
MVKQNKPITKLSRTDLIWLEICTRCGLCTKVCPIYIETKDIDFSPAKRASLLLSILYDFEKSVSNQLTMKNLLKASYKCLLCDRCSRACPFGIWFSDIWVRTRALCYENGIIPESLLALSEALSKHYNPYSIPPQNRLNYLKTAGLWEKQLIDKDEAEMVYFLGCTASYVPESQTIALSTINILQKMGEDFTILSEERCCGRPIQMLGDSKLLKEFAKQNVKKIIERKAKYVVTSCPTCRFMLKYMYPRILSEEMPFRVFHILEIINNYLEEGKLRIERKLRELVTYHDPCDFARFGEMLDEPRHILSKLVTKYVEMPDNRQDTLCCGGGGLLEIFDNKIRSLISKRRIKQAVSLGAEVLATSCPACKMYLYYAAKAEKSDIKVMDVMEIINKIIEK